MSIMLNELEEAPRVIADCISACAPVSKQIAECTEKRGLKRVFVAGRGSSLHAGIAFKFFTEISTPLSVTFDYPSLITLYNIKRDLSDALYVIISQSGAGPDTVAFAKAAKAQGATTVACTNFDNSPLASLCDFTLNISAGEEKAVAATKTLTGEIVALETLAAALCGEELKADFAKESINFVLNTSLPDVTDTLLKSDKIICLSRGVTEAVAKECGLKLMETCYRFTYSSSTNEFKHGPQALVAADVPVILFAPDGKCRDYFVSAAADLKAKGAYLVAFTDINEVAAAADLTFKMPFTEEKEQTVVYLVAMQRFVESLCHTLGLNPDAPRNLNKVTITT